MLVKGAPGDKSLYQLIVELLIYVYIFAQPLQLSYKAHGHRLTCGICHTQLPYCYEHM